MEMTSSAAMTNTLLQLLVLSLIEACEKPLNRAPAALGVLNKVGFWSIPLSGQMAM
jgi:hypothetical protein